MTENIIEKGESWWKTAIFFIPRIIANIFDSLKSDDSGYSIRKLGFAFCLAVAAVVTYIHINPENYHFTLWIWIGFAGLLLCIYKLDDIGDFFIKIKGNGTNDK